jgi:hypothetical protein
MANQIECIAVVQEKEELKTQVGFHYYEFRILTKQGYVYFSKYFGETEPTLPGSFSEGFRPFESEELTAKHISDTNDYLQALNNNQAQITGRSFGVDECFYWIASQKNHQYFTRENGDKDYDKYHTYLQALCVTKIVEEKNHWVCTFTDIEGKTFNLYAHSTPLPQEAIDVLTIFVERSMAKTEEEIQEQIQNGTLKAYTYLARKKRSSCVTTHFGVLGNGKTVTNLSVCFYGKVLPGEHVEQKKDGNTYMMLYQTGVAVPHYVKNDAAASRTAYEELGVPKETPVSIIYVGTDTMKGRDPRYAPFGPNKEFGWMHKSVCHQTIAIYIVNSFDDIKLDYNPADEEEVDKPIILNFQQLCHLFDSNADELAFASHPRQFNIMVKPNLAKSIALAFEHQQ